LTPEGRYVTLALGCARWPEMGLPSYDIAISFSGMRHTPHSLRWGTTERLAYQFAYEGHTANLYVDPFDVKFATFETAQYAIRRAFWCLGGYGEYDPHDHVTLSEN